MSIRSKLDHVPLNASWLHAEVTESLSAVEELSSYLDFLEAARDHKSKTVSRSVSFEREVLEHARRAERGTRRLLGGTLRVLKHLKNAGLVDEAMNHWTREIEKRGKLSFADYWKELLEDSKTRDRFREVGVSQRTINRLSEAADRLTLPLEVQDGKLIFRGEGTRTTVVQRRKLFAGTIADVLNYDLFDAAAELFERTDAVPPNVLARVSGMEDLTVDPLDNFLAVATEAQRSVTAHVRKLEDAGLSVYEGNDPLTAVVIIVAAVAATALGIVIVCELTDGGTVCDYAKAILAFLGTILVIEGCQRHPNCEVVVIGLTASRMQIRDGSLGFGG